MIDIELDSDKIEDIIIELNVIKHNNIQLRLLKEWYKYIEHMEIDDMEEFCKVLMFVNAYKEFISIVNELPLTEINYTYNGESFRPSGIKLDDVQYKKYQDKTITTFDCIVIVAENKLGFKGCDYEEVIGEILDSVIGYIKDHDLVDIVLRHCDKISVIKLLNSDWYGKLEDRLRY